MSQFVPFSEDVSVSPTSTTQDCETASSLPPLINDAAASRVELPSIEASLDIDNGDTPTLPLTDLDKRLLAQAQRDANMLGKNVLKGLQSLPDFSKMMPPNFAQMLPYTEPPIHLFESVGSAIVKEIQLQSITSQAIGASWLSENIGAHVASSQRLLLTPVMDDFYTTTTAMFSSLGESAAFTLGEIARSNLTFGIGDILANWGNMFPIWESFTQPQLTFPTLGIANPLLSLTSSLPDMSWITNLTDQMNSILTSLPSWPSFDLKRLKESIKQRLIAVFKAIEFCFAPSMSEELMYKIADTLESRGKRSSITPLLWNYYARRNHEKLQQTVEGWQDNPEFARRWKQNLLPALQAHQRGEYSSSIYTLAPLVEGISSHVVKKNTLPLSPGEKKRRGSLNLGSTRSVILRALKTAGDEANLEIETTDMLHWLRVKSIIGYVEDVYCKDIDFENDYDSIHLRDNQLHRHGILHGFQTNAMTALNSLRLFLILDTMHGLLQQYIAKGGLF